MSTSNKNNVPIEFTKENIASKTINLRKEERMYETHWSAGEPYRSLYEHNKHIGAKYGYGLNASNIKRNAKTDGLDLNDENLYYNTNNAISKNYWKNIRLPQPNKDLTQLRQELKTWGYCLIQDALSPEQLHKLRTRIKDQMEGEKLAGVASWNGVKGKSQYVHTLLNKGEQFRQCVAHDPAGVQAGPLIERLITETVGPDFIMESFLAITAYKNNMPQGLHQDNGVGGIQTLKTPVSLNTMYIMDDVNHVNGGTLVVPGSHLIIAKYGTSEKVEEALPPAINVEAPAGTVMLFEGRLLHGTGVNRTNKPRTVMVMNSTPYWYRAQENFMLSADPSWLKTASPKLLYRIGAVAGQRMPLGWVEGASGYLVQQRLAIERGEYVRIGELGPNSSKEDLMKDYTFRHSDSGRELLKKQVDAIDEVKKMYDDNNDNVPDELYPDEWITPERLPLIKPLGDLKDVLKKKSKL